MKPTREALEKLYLDEHNTTRQIGELYQVSKTEVLRWMRGYNIPRRPPNNGVIHRGGTIPDKEVLYDLIYEQNYSYHQVAEIYRCHDSMVGYWLDKYGIPKPTAHREKYRAMQQINKELLYNLYVEQRLSNDEIASRFDFPPKTITILLKHYGIQKRPSGWRDEYITCEDGHLVKSTYELKVDNWLYQNGINHLYEPRLPFNRRYRADF
jgi:transposase